MSFNSSSIRTPLPRVPWRGLVGTTGREDYATPLALDLLDRLLRSVYTDLYGDIYKMCVCVCVCVCMCV